MFIIHEKAERLTTDRLKPRVDTWLQGAVSSKIEEPITDALIKPMTLYTLSVTTLRGKEASATSHSISTKDGVMYGARKKPTRNICYAHHTEGLRVKR